MDPSEHAILTPPMRLQPWIRHYNESTGRDDRQDAAMRIIREREDRQLQLAQQTACSECATVDTPYTPRLHTILSMPRFQVPPQGPLEPSYSSLRADGALPVIMKLAQS